MVRFLFCALLFVFSNLSINGQERIEPPFWWAGMEVDSLQIMVYSEDVGELRAVVMDQAVSLIRAHNDTNPNYQFLDLKIPKSYKGGVVEISFLDKNEKEKLHINYTIKKRVRPQSDFAGFDPSDVIYLVTPDRFSNGNPTNDEVVGLLEGLDRQAEYGRHGGDIQGIIDHLDYIDEMGFTAIWINPLLENNMPSQSYHGYATTDYFKTDPRYGNNEDYLKLAEMARNRGIKLIMDQVANHSGSNHWWMKDMPTSDWVHFSDSIEVCNHRKTTAIDPYAAKVDRKYMTDGWFVPQMPDLNQNNRFMSTYLIQNSIWWIEFAGLGGIRQDTYSYPDKDFLTNWTCSIMSQYPNFNIVGEEWTENPVVVSYWQAGNNTMDAYHSCLPSVMDFPVQMTMRKALTETPSWNKGMTRLYEVLANDVLYPDPSQLMIFADNHDMSRVYTQMNEEVSLWKMAMTYVLTMRGIPQIYYGTEVLMGNPGTESHGIIRADMPGGWAGDKVNAFTGEGLTEEQIDAQSWLRKLLNWRKKTSTIHEGDLLHFEPKDEVYVFFRYDDHKKVMILLNRNPKFVKLDCSRFTEIINKGDEFLDPMSMETGVVGNHLTLEGKSIRILEFD